MKTYRATDGSSLQVEKHSDGTYTLTMVGPDSAWPDVVLIPNIPRESLASLF